MTKRADYARGRGHAVQLNQNAIAIKFLKSVDEVKDKLQLTNLSLQYSFLPYNANEKR